MVRLRCLPLSPRTSLTTRQALYAEMREGLLSDASAYASKPLTDHLKREPACCSFALELSSLNESVFLRAQVLPSRLTRCSFQSWRTRPRLRDCVPRFPCLNAPSSSSVYPDRSRNPSKRSASSLICGVIECRDQFSHRASMKLLYERTTRANFYGILGKVK